ncbi:hypothetical protein SSP531S_47370 [Streptomyces spongiicola]|uniref:Uncharacterized protein n=1 Tax=Streptomyces spongiicola TaxID=1690221 RepID=A0A2S1Z0B6_9ACTN|nr:hypothetical protein [Streptomyces spongiicola]AWK09789.1 hypothetical protein DDQ41_13660 [Streptomyces spongiicola]GBQ03267.1 hypothetical protein SSP531S_47370 [Streptomyces spongiicola]
MSAATLTPASRPGRGATATGAPDHRPHRLGNALRAVRVFVVTAFKVAVLGEYSEEAGVRGHR